jgi:Reverse transcriptase (RNA-dependent DNA polymerase)
MSDPYGDDEEGFVGSLTDSFASHVSVGEYLNANRGKLTFCHVNCNHLVPHINELRILLQDSGVDIVGVGETFLTDSISSKAIEIKGYRFIRNDRSVLLKKTGGGGVGLYLKNGLMHKIVASSVGLGIEYLFVEAHCGRENVLIGVIYRPPNTSVVYHGLESGNYGLHELEKILADLLPSYRKAYLFGDLNIDLLDSNNLLYDSFIDLLNIFMLYNVSRRPTRQASGKLLDLFLTTDCSTVTDFYQHEICWSDHDMIFMSVGAIQPLIKSIEKLARNFKKIEQSDLLEAAVMLDWDCIPLITSVDEKINVFYEFLNHLLDTFAPTKKVKVKYDSNKLNSIDNWCGDDVKNAIEIRNEAYKIWRGNINRRKGDRNWLYYSEKRRIAKKLITQSHSSFVHKNLDPRLPSSTLFSNLRKFGITKGKNIVNFDLNAEDICDHFTVKMSDNSQLDFNIPEVTGVSKFSFKAIDCSDVLDAVKSIKSDAAGDDGIPMSFLKLLLPVILPTITHIFNKIFYFSEFPRRWKTSIVIPVPKVNSPSALSDFRPISLLPCMSKILEVIMSRQMTVHISNNNLLSPYQSGFRRMHSTTTAVLKVTEDIRLNMEKRQATVLVLLDFSQAFDTVVRALLTMKMRHSYAFDDDANKLLGSYLSDRSQFVRTDDGDSECRTTTCGVPQGSVLGPLLYICYSNDVAGVIEFCKFHAYADDLQLYHSADVSNLQRCYDEINSDLGRIAEWAHKNGLKLNPKKSQVILIHRLPGDLPEPFLVIESNVVKIVPKVVDLGFVLNTRLTPVDHFSRVCQKIYWVLRSIRPHANCTPLAIRKKLIQVLVMTHINYSNIVYAHVDSASARKLGVAINACIRYIHGLGRRDSVRDLQSSITGLPLRAAATLQILKFLFKIMKSQHPSYIFTLVSYGSSQRLQNLNLPTFRRSAMAHSFVVVASKMWNELPHSTKTINVLGRFVTAVKLHLSRLHLSRLPDS